MSGGAGKVLKRAAATSVVLVLGLSVSVSAQELRGRATPSASTQPTTTSKTGVSPDSIGASRVAMALGAVIALIFAAKWGAGALMGKAAPGRASSAISVVSRSTIGPRQQLMLVQVGRRLVLVGNSGGQMSSLCEIREPEEVGELLGKAHAERGDSITKTFSTLFRKEEAKFDEHRSPEESHIETSDGDDLGTTREELKSLADTVRGLSKQFRST